MASRLVNKSIKNQNKYIPCMEYKDISHGKSIRFSTGGREKSYMWQCVELIMSISCNDYEPCCLTNPFRSEIYIFLICHINIFLMYWYINIWERSGKWATRVPYKIDREKISATNKKSKNCKNEEEIQGRNGETTNS